MISARTLPSFRSPATCFTRLNRFGSRLPVHWRPSLFTNTGSVFALPWHWRRKISSDSSLRVMWRMVGHAEFAISMRFPRMTCPVRNIVLHQAWLLRRLRLLWSSIGSVRLAQRSDICLVETSARSGCDSRRTELAARTANSSSVRRSSSVFWVALVFFRRLRTDGK